MFSFALLIVAEWGLFALSWILAASWSSAVDKRLGLQREVLYRVVLIVGALLLAIPAHGYHGRWRIWFVTPAQAWACATCIAAGFAFAWWARVHLGELWSGRVTAKANHRVIDTGPYRLVRHPIYTGILLSVFATAVIKGTIPGLAGALVIALGIWMKARLEERWLSSELEAGSYGRYRERVPMLVPFPWGRR